MSLTKRSSIADVAGVVSEALERAGIRTVLSGGACASIHSQGAYQSVDIDFIVQSAATQPAIERALAPEGFHRRGDQYFHDLAPYYIEFPPGPIAIGSDYSIAPIVQKLGAYHVRMLSATDSCRDRLAAAFHWRDAAAMRAAVEIALRNEVDFHTIKRWSESERSLDRYEAFLEEVKKSKKRRRARGRTR